VLKACLERMKVSSPGRRRAVKAVAAKRGRGNAPALTARLRSGSSSGRARCRFLNGIANFAENATFRDSA